MQGPAEQRVAEPNCAPPAPAIAAATSPDEAFARWSAANFRRVFESNIVGVIVADLSGHLTVANDCFLHMVGYERADLPIRWDTMTPPEWGLLDEKKIRELRSTGEAQNWDKEFFSKSGDRIPITLCVVMLEKQEEEQCLCMILDRTERRKSEDARRRSDDRYQQRLRVLALQLAVTAERERHRIAVGLHDQIGQTLAVTRMKLDSLRNSEPDATRDVAFEELTTLLDDTVRATRSLTFELSPPMLYELGLEAALRALATQMSERDGIPCRFESDGQPLALAGDAAIVVHQVVRELLFNVVKHARAESAGVYVTQVEDRLRIEVRDDGIGFDATEADELSESDPGYGLFSARERLRPIGGTFEIETAPGQGTCIVMTLPPSPTKREGA